MSEACLCEDAARTTSSLLTILAVRGVERTSATVPCPQPCANVSKPEARPSSLPAAAEVGTASSNNPNSGRTSSTNGPASNLHALHVGGLSSSASDGSGLSKSTSSGRSSHTFAALEAQADSETYHLIGQQAHKCKTLWWACVKKGSNHVTFTSWLQRKSWRDDSSMQLGFIVRICIRQTCCIEFYEKMGAFTYVWRRQYVRNVQRKRNPHDLLRQTDGTSKQPQPAVATSLDSLPTTSATKMCMVQPFPNQLFKKKTRRGVGIYNLFFLECFSGFAPLFAFDHGLCY